MLPARRDAAEHPLGRAGRRAITDESERILRKGDHGDSMFFIASGAVRLSLASGDIELGSGAFFGELALITGRPRSNDVISLGFCQLLELGEPDFRTLLAADATMKREIEGIAQERLGAAK